MATASFTRLVRAIHNTTSFGDSVPTWVEGLPVGPGDLQVRLMDPAAKTPQRAHQTDAGLDLATLEDSVLHHGGRMLLRTGIQAPPPEGWWGLIKARSSTQKLGIQINEAVIDAGYQGELMISATLIHQGRSSMKIEAGTRLAQYILIPAFTGSVRQVDSFAPSLRGDRGFGSSGA
jgi:dUTP pyrophosphatase